MFLTFIITVSQLSFFKPTINIIKFLCKTCLITSTVIVFSVKGASIEDNTPPVITLIGDSTINWTQGYEYKDFGATATDEIDGQVNVTQSGKVDIAHTGTYSVIYTANDAAGNKARAVRKVKVVTSTAFITTWNDPWNNHVYIRTKGDGYNFSVDWGDGTVEHNITEEIGHTYDYKGNHTVSITGVFPQFYGGEHLISVEQWGNGIWSNMERTFSSSDHLVINATDTPILHQVTSMERMFAGVDSFNADISDWDVSRVTNMEAMFAGVDSFNADISGWDVSNVTNMSSMFEGAESFNQNINNWDVSNVTNMSRMFEGAESFNQNINNWDVSNVTNMERMFNDAKSFNQNIGNWNVSNVTNMNGMFNRAKLFNKDIRSWNVSNVTSMIYMFADTTYFNQNIKDWDVSNVIDMSHMFSFAKVFNQPIGNWDVSNVTDMNSMLFAAYSFNQDLSRWDVSNVTNMDTMLDSTGLSVKNYDALLNGWSKQNLTGWYVFSWRNLLYDIPIKIETSANYSDAGADARRALNFNYSWKIKDKGYLDTSVPDTTAPVLKLLGKKRGTIFVGNGYYDAGARALDDRDGSIKVDIKGTVDASTIGYYTLTYTATDSAGNVSNTVTRKITVR